MNYIKRYNEWLNSSYIDEMDKKELIDIKDDYKEIEDRFYKDLEFGTGGLRGVIGTGTNRINIYNIRKTTQGLADYLISSDKDSLKKGVAIAYDSRHFSDVFAKEASLVLAGNGIKAYLFESLRTTPELSFAVRYLNCSAGIVITASHNPSKYNGYKVYGSDGGQVTLEFAKGIMESITKVDDWDRIKRLDEYEASEKNLLNIIGKEVDEVYIENVLSLSKRKNTSDIKVVYTPLHGTGLMPIESCLDKLGYDIHLVESQTTPDGDFPTIESPNPEEHDAFIEAIKVAKSISADIILGTDPDCDRVGVVVKNYEEEYQVLTGNQVGALLVKYVLSSRENITDRDAVIKTIVTSDLGANIADSFGATVFNTLTGFKFIGEKIKEFEDDNSYNFLLGYEESYGYLAGTFVRDKDAVIASMLIVEMAAHYKKLNKTLFDGINDIYEEYGYYLDSLESFVFNGIEGQRKMKNTMKDARDIDKLIEIYPNIKYIEDYKKQERYFVNSHETEQISLPKSDVVKIVLSDESWIAIRPSGTEPKIKIYYSSVGKSKNGAMDIMTRLKLSIKELL
jgi:phosphoglucomutase